MKLEVYTVYDNAVGAFLRPFFVRSRGEAIRSFTDAVNDPKSEIGSHREDFTLFMIGYYDDNAGLVSSIATPDRVISALECADPDDPGRAAKF